MTTLNAEALETRVLSSCAFTPQETIDTGFRREHIEVTSSVIVPHDESDDKKVVR